MCWQAFNWLAGNSDSHAKNLALLYAGRRIQLAPFYDLVCTRAIARLDRRLAMGIGGETDPGKITSSHWDALARDCGVRPHYVRRLVQTLAERIAENRRLSDRYSKSAMDLRRRCSESSALSFVSVAAQLTRRQPHPCIALSARGPCWQFPRSVDCARVRLKQAASGGRRGTGRRESYRAAEGPRLARAERSRGARPLPGRL